MLVKLLFSLILFIFCPVLCLPTTSSVGLLGKVLADYAAEHAGTTVAKVEDGLGPNVETLLGKLSINAAPEETILTKLPVGTSPQMMAKSLPIKIPHQNGMSQSLKASSRSPRSLVFSHSQNNDSPRNPLEAISLSLDPIAHPSSPPQKRERTF